VKTGDYDEAVWDSLALKMCLVDEYWEERERTILRESWFIARFMSGVMVEIAEVCLS